jgi:hypothetical protein
MVNMMLPSKKRASSSLARRHHMTARAGAASALGRGCGGHVFPC